MWLDAVGVLLMLILMLKMYIGVQKNCSHERALFVAWPRYDTLTAISSHGCDYGKFKRGEKHRYFGNAGHQRISSILQASEEMRMPLHVHVHLYCLAYDHAISSVKQNLSVLCLCACTAIQETELRDLVAACEQMAEDQTLWDQVVERSTAFKEGAHDLVPRRDRKLPR
jgi:hypothetical protein